MKTLTKLQFDQIENWILRHARPLDYACFNVQFMQSKVESYLNILAQYQNSDGGFGHAIDPDNWSPHSTPYDTLKAIHLMQGVGFMDISHPLYQGAIRYLRQTENHGWPFTLPQTDAYPHAPWWTYSEQTNRKESPGLSAQIAAFLLMACPPDDPLYAKAQSVSLRALDALMNGTAGGEMGVAACAMLLPHWTTVSVPFPMSEIEAKLKAASLAAIVTDPALWHTYVPRPSAAIRSPQSPMYAGNEAALHAELDWLIDTLPADDVWPLTWSWGDNAARYPEAYSVNKLWWKAAAAIDHLLLLRSFHRLP